VTQLVFILDFVDLWIWDTHQIRLTTSVRGLQHEQAFTYSIQRQVLTESELERPPDRRSCPSSKHMTTLYHFNWCERKSHANVRHISALVQAFECIV
jgi:hypothetical protein